MRKQRRRAGTKPPDLNQALTHMSNGSAIPACADNGIGELLARWNDEVLPWLITQLDRKGVLFHDAEEASQKALVKLHRRGNSSQPLKSKERWLLKVAWREFLRECERRNGEAKKLEGRSWAGVVRTVDHPTSDMETSELQETVAAAMTSLSFEESEAIRLRFGEDWNITDISRGSGVTRATVGKRLRRGLKKLTSALIQAGFDGER